MQIHHEQIYLFHPMAVSVGMSTFEVPFPSLITIMSQVRHLFRPF